MEGGITRDPGFAHRQLSVAGGELILATPLVRPVLLEGV
jgi:hypothetical protein